MLSYYGVNVPACRDKWRSLCARQAYPPRLEPVPVFAAIMRRGPRAFAEDGGSGPT